MTPLPRALIEPAYFRYAQEYLYSLPPEHFMEATTQSRQREITLASLAVVRERHRDFHLFNELLVQYPRKGQKRPGQVVPDNMVVLHDGPIEAEGSYDTPLQPAPPYWVLEYVSKSNSRKDYDDNMVKYEKELKVPYYLVFYPDTQDLSLFALGKRKYVSVKPNADDRLELPQLEMEMALIGEWVRFWHRGEMLPLTGELVRKLESEQNRTGELERELAEARAEIARLKGQK